MYGKKSKMIAEASSFSSFAVAASSNGGGVVFDINHGYTQIMLATLLRLSRVFLYNLLLMIAYMTNQGPR